MRRSTKVGLSPYQTIENQRALIAVIRNHDEALSSRLDYETIDALDDALDALYEFNTPLPPQDELTLRGFLRELDTKAVSKTKSNAVTPNPSSPWARRK